MKTLLMLFISFYYFSGNNDCQNYIKNELLPMEFVGEVISKELQKDGFAVIIIKNKEDKQEKYLLNLNLIDDGKFFQKIQKGNWAIKKQCEQAFKIAIMNTNQSADIFTYPVKCR
jgi:hypothetical protein